MADRSKLRRGLRPLLIAGASGAVIASMTFAACTETTSGNLVAPEVQPDTFVSGNLVAPDVQEVDTADPPVDATETDAATD